MRKIAFILNPISGAGYKQEIVSYINRIHAKYPDNEFHFHTTSCTGDANKAAADFVAGGFDTVVAIGGDGTVNEVAKALVGSGVKLGIIPAGSGNGLARHLGIPMNFQGAVQVLMEGSLKKIDAGKINDQYFFCTAGIGFDAVVGEKFNGSTARGLVSYMEHCAKEYVKYEPEKYVIDISGTRFRQEAFLITFANSSQWGNNAFIAPDANISDGMMDVVVWRKSPMVTMPLMTAELFFRTIKYSEFVDTYRCREVCIGREHEGVIQFDGESMQMGKEIRISVIHDALEVVVPHQTSAVSQVFDMMPQNMKEMLPQQFWVDLFHQLKEISPQQLKEKVPYQLKDIVPKLKKMKNEGEK